MTRDRFPLTALERTRSPSSTTDEKLHRRARVLALAAREGTVGRFSIPEAFSSR